jgi:glycosidase
MTDANGLGDFIFGTLASSADRVKALSRARRGLAAPVFELNDGLGSSARVILTAGPDAPVEEVTLYFTNDGSEPTPGAESTYALAFTEFKPVWDTIVWGYIRNFEAIIPPMLLPYGAIIHYRAVGKTRGKEVIQAADGQRFSYELATHLIPDWLQQGLIYHVFLDRFATTGGQPFATPKDLTGFFGGTLRGVTEKLDYIRELGATILWLSPLFPSPSHHGYDATDFRAVEPRLGTDADLHALIDAAHARGLRVLLDFVPNHVSNEHPFFLDAQSKPDSKYRDYFTFTQWPDEYESFFGVKTLPQINNEFPPARQYVIDSAVYWLREFDVDGFRLDYANGPSHDFWADYFAAVKAVAPNSAHFGEIVETPELLRSYTGRLDGALDFHFVQAIRKTFAFDTLSVEGFDAWLRCHQAYFAKSNFVLPNFLDNHDMNRFLWTAGNDIQRLKLAALVQFTLPQPPIIYYGTESGLSQERDIRQPQGGIMEEARLPMNWDNINVDLLAFYKRLAVIRAEIADVFNGTRITFVAEAATGRYAYGYYAESVSRGGELTVVTLINHSPEPHSFQIEALGGWRDLFNDARYSADENPSVVLAPYSGTILERSTN